jgi:hypothetical protein
VTPAPIVVPGADSPETAASLGSPAREPDAWSLVTEVAADESMAAGADIRAGDEAKDGGHGPDDRS